MHRRATGRTSAARAPFCCYRSLSLSTSTTRSTSAWAIGWPPAGRCRASVLRVYIRFESSRFGVSPKGFHGESTRFEPPGVSPNSPSSHATCLPPGVRGEAPGNENASSQRLASRFARRGDTLSRSATPRVGVLDLSKGPGGAAAGVTGTSDQRTPSRPWRAAAVAAAGATASSSSSSRRPRGDVGPGGTRTCR